MNQNNSSAPELLPCPFCGGAARVESNRDWHKLRGDHDDDCVFVEPVTLAVPATDEQLTALVTDWNRRAQPPSDRVQGGLTELASCSTEEVAAFEAWAAGEKYDMVTHPLHWLFLNERTYAARQGWKAALKFARAILSSQSMMGGEVRAKSDFLNHLQVCSDKVATWPAWKRRPESAAASKEKVERSAVPEQAARILESAFFGQANWFRVREVTAAIRALAAPSPKEGKVRIMRIECRKKSAE